MSEDAHGLTTEGTLLHVLTLSFAWPAEDALCSKGMALACVTIWDCAADETSDMRAGQTMLA